SKPWDRKKISGTDEEFYSCQYVARDRDGNVVNKQVLWYFPNAPTGADDSKSNRWVYWVNPEKLTVWGRCPTPKHPKYEEWKKDTGVDLWHLTPPKDRPSTKATKDGIDIRKSAALFGATVGADSPNAPRLEPKADPKKPGDLIVCVDFTND